MQSRTINTHNATSIPISLPHRISVLQMQLLFSICRSHILKLLCRNPAAQQLFLFPLCRSLYLLFQLQVIDRIRDCHVPHTFRRSMNRNHARKRNQQKYNSNSVKWNIPATTKMSNNNLPWAALCWHLY